MERESSGGRLRTPGLVTQIDRYLRRENTLLAKTLKKVSPLEGEEYRKSPFRESWQRPVAKAAAVVTSPISSYLESRAGIYTQERIGKDGQPVIIRKIKTMNDGVDKKTDFKGEPELNPDATPFGRKIRSWELDELPQLLQIAKGELSLVDLRILRPEAIAEIKTARPTTYTSWEKVYLAAKPGLFSLFSAMSSKRKDATKRYYYDMLYARRASLGLDLYIFWRTGLRMSGKALQKVKLFF